MCTHSLIHAHALTTNAACSTSASVSRGDFSKNDQLPVFPASATISLKLCSAWCVHICYMSNSKSILGWMLCRHLDFCLYFFAAGQMSLWNGYGRISILYPHRCDCWKCTGCVNRGMTEAPVFLTARGSSSLTTQHIWHVVHQQHTAVEQVLMAFNEVKIPL